MANPSHTTWARVLTAGLAALVLGACGAASTTTGTTSAGSGPTTSAAASSATAAGTPVGVTEREFSITLSQASLSPGSYTFTIQNQGRLPHNLNVQGPGVDTATSPTLSPGQSGTLSVTLRTGSYELWCSVPGHKDKGMDLTIKVG